MMLIQDLEQIKRLFNRLDGPVAGVGMTAFSRIIPSFFVPSYRIVCAQKTCDLAMLREHAPVFCLEEKVENGICNAVENSFHLLSNPRTVEHLKRQKGGHSLFLYQNYSELEALSKNQGWTLLANSFEIRKRMGERAFFEKAAVKLGLPKIPGGIFPFGMIGEWTYEKWEKELGPKFVVQLPDVHKGGGRGTFFVESEETYSLLREKLADGTWRGVRLSSVLVRRFLEGIPASVAVCATREGVLLSGLQKQLIDLPYCRGLDENGIFCGHVWGEDIWPASVLTQARELGRKVGEFLASLGYRGIAGIDFMVQPKVEKVYPLEINPRLTGAFPMLSLLHLGRGTIPMEAFHLLEFLNVPCRFDLESVNRQYAQPLIGTQLLVFCGVDREISGFRPLPAGIWEYSREKGSGSFLKASLNLEDVKKPGGFILADGPPAGNAMKSGIFNPLSRVCRILFPCNVEQEKDLLTDIPAIVEWIRKTCMTQTLKPKP